MESCGVDKCDEALIDTLGVIGSAVTIDISSIVTFGGAIGIRVSKDIISVTDVVIGLEFVS